MAVGGSESGRTPVVPQVNSPPRAGAGDRYMKVLLTIAILWLVGNLMYAVAPAVREGYSWAGSNLYNVKIIMTVGCVTFVGVYVWG